MPTYYLATTPRGENGQAVHKKGCGHMPKRYNRIRLGVFPSCHEAVEAARKIYPKADGCFY